MNLQSFAGVGSILAVVVLVLAVLFGSGLIAASPVWIWVCVGALAIARLT